MSPPADPPPKRSSSIKTDEKKQHFDDIYVADTPVPYKEQILDGLSYISDNFNRQTFDRLILPWILQQGKSIEYLDLCACFGNTTMAAVYGMDYDQIRDNWKDENACKSIQGTRRFPCHTVAVDISQSAMAYGKEVGLFDEVHVCDLNEPTAESPVKQAVLEAMKQTDMLLSTAALVYLDLDTIDELLRAYASKPAEGYVLVNFLNPFALEKGDATKRKLLEHLEFVGSTATRHRKLSPLEQENYPGEEWSLLELWVLRRRTSNGNNE